jgi:integrase/recombinase XerD
MPLRRKKHNHRMDRKRPVEHNGLYPYMARFLAWGESIAQVSAETTRRHDNALRRFIEWCDERGLHDPREITKPMLERYQRHLYYYRKVDGQPLSSGSQNVMLSPLKTFFRWLTRENYLASNPASEMVLPRKPRALPRHVLHLEEVERVLAQPDLATPSGLRDRTMMEVLYATGMRRMEVSRLSIYDIDVRRTLAFIRQGKGRKDRVVPLGARALAWVQQYLEEVRPQLASAQDDGTLFLTDYGGPFNAGVLGWHIKRYFKAADIQVTGGCHLFRHACATHMLENGADIRFIQVLLGHENLDTTEIYTRVSIEKLQEIHAATHPAKLPGDRAGRSLAGMALSRGWEAKAEDGA